MAYRYPSIEISTKRVPTDEPAPVERFTRSNFIGAGVDNFAQAPSQDPDMMMRLDNIMPISNGTLQRRWVYTLWDNPGSVPTSQMYSYQSDVTQRREIILTTPTTVRAQNE